VVAIGASTGGPQAVQTVLRALPAVLLVPILLVQRITAGFIDGFAEWLRSTTGLSVRLAQHEETVRPGVVYLAPDNFHMEMGPNQTIVLKDSSNMYGVRPSVGHLFRSVATHYGANAVGALLTGMGKDGAAELKVMRERGALTVGQDEASCVVYGMRGVAAQIGAVTHELPLSEIDPFLRTQLHAGNRVAEKGSFSTKLQFQPTGNK